MKNKSIFIFCLSLLILSVSCASHTAVYPDPVNIQSVIQTGDKVKIVTNDNQEAEFVVTEVNDEYIIGENIKVPLKDITGMKEETVSAGKNALIVTVLTVGISAVSAYETATVEDLDDIFETTAEGNLALGILEDVPGWVKGCTPYYPSYHPGDMLATGLSSDYIAIDERLCIDECSSRYSSSCSDPIEDSRQKYFKGIQSCNDKLFVCKFDCIEKGHPVGDIAEGTQGGYYSDGSYYSTCKSDKSNPFLNLHPTQGKYQQTKWQKDRDECMRLTYENVKTSFWAQSGTVKFINRSHNNYRESLNERGYSIIIYQ